MKSHRTPSQASVCATITLIVTLTLACIQGEAQDLLRRHQQQARQLNSPETQNALNALANIQLPPQLAALTPEQLHQLAQLRELQLQQEAVAKQQDYSAPAPIGLEAQIVASHQQQQSPTVQPAANSNNGQIPQPGAGAGSQATNSAEHQDESGAYNESGSELEGVAMSTGGAEPAANEADAKQADGTQGTSSSSSAPTFEVNWNKCPQLEPSESEKTKKTQVITKCLQAAPIPTNLTRENVEAHREQIATCALRVEGWFDDSGAYRYEKAEAEIKAKKLDAPIELQVLKFHIACKDEANKKFPRDQNKLIDQVQFYQACMDYYISIVCEIEVSVDQ